mmetsp:Transcript_37912/g.88222  ORF Transcript_37912/g.88222 Transcript_37912/m.88222 type:complete len:203 (-) Transcript_37912:9-617(-)
MSVVRQRKLESVEQHPLRKPIFRHQQLSVPLRRQTLPHGLHFSERLDARGGRFDGGAGDLEVLLNAHDVLPLDVVGPHLSLELVPAGGTVDDEAPQRVAVFLKETSHASHHPGGLVGDRGQSGGGGEDEGKGARGERGHGLAARGGRGERGGGGVTGGGGGGEGGGEVRGEEEEEGAGGFSAGGNHGGGGMCRIQRNCGIGW